jgi:hypothetical protein
MNRVALFSPEGITDRTIRERLGSPGLSKPIFVATLAIALLLLLLLELRLPYYFLQDDNLEYFLPLFFHNWQSLLAGKLPLYDFHIYAGIPHASRGLPAVFYLPQYVAMFLSEAIWGHPFAAMDLMSIMHALIAVAGGYVLLRYLGVTDRAAAFGALTALSGYFLWCGRLWITATMLGAWFPWMVWASLRYLERPRADRAGWLMVFRLALLFGGYPQYFVLAMIFEHLFALSHSLATRRSGWAARCAGYLALDIPTALLGLPLLLPMWAEVGRSLDRSTPLSYAEFSGLHVSPIWWAFGQLFVFIRLRLPRDYIQASIPYLSYIGYFASLLPLGAGVLWKKRPQSRPWIIASGACFLLAFLWCSNIMGPLIFRMPVLNRFRWPFKLVFFAGFFQCLVAALALMLLRKRWQRIAIGGFIANWIVVFCFLPNHAWRIREYRPPLKPPWQENVENGRYIIISRSPVLLDSKEYLERNYSEFWGLDNLLGYEPLVPRLNGTLLLGRPMTDLGRFGGAYDGEVDQPLIDHLKKWSVKYLLVGPSRANLSERLVSAGYQAQSVKQGWTLWKDPNALSRVRWGGDSLGSKSSDSIRWVEHVNSIDVYLSQWPGRQLVFAFAASQGLQTCMAEDCEPVVNSPDGLVRVDIPGGTKQVRLVYRNALFLPAILVALATLAVYFLLLLRSRRSAIQPTLVDPDARTVQPSEENRQAG